MLKREVKKMRREFNDSEERWGKEREELKARVKELEEKVGIFESRGKRRDVESGKEKGAQEGTMERLRDRKKDGMERERKEKRM